MPSPRKRPTVKDVAAEAGVGVMTVSYTFNRPERVAEQTRARVLAAARTLGYNRPDGTARALRTGRTGQIGVVFGEHLSYAFDDPQAAAFLAGIADVCVDAGLGMMLLPTHGHPGDVDRVLGAAVDGYVLWTTTEDDPVLEAVAHSGRPAVIQGGPEISGITRIGGDDREAARAVATTALAGGGSPVILSFPLDKDRTSALTVGADLEAHVRFPVTRLRLEGYQDAITAGGGDWEATPIAVLERNRRDLGEAGMARLLAHLPPGEPLVVLAMSDELALGARDALVSAGHEAVLAGWDGAAAALACGIITVTNPLREQGRQCAHAVLHPTEQVPEVSWQVIGP